MQVSSPVGLRRRLAAAFHDQDSREWLITQVVVTLLVVLSIALLAAEIVWDDDRPILRELELVDDVLLWVFVAELALRLATYEPPELRFYRADSWARLRWGVVGRLRFLVQPLNLADALAVLAVIPALRGLRAFATPTHSPAWRDRSPTIACRSRWRSAFSS